MTRFDKEVVQGTGAEFVSEAAQAGKSIAPGLALDSAGRPTMKGTATW